MYINIWYILLHNDDIFFLAAPNTHMNFSPMSEFSAYRMCFSSASLWSALHLTKMFVLRWDHPGYCVQSKWHQGRLNLGIVAAWKIYSTVTVKYLDPYVMYKLDWCQRLHWKFWMKTPNFSHDYVRFSILFGNSGNWSAINLKDVLDEGCFKST